ncbi:DUF58 domain-containing protein [Arsenicicoccus sp. oral taxon 190]|uniref:DUF58 domain-containing protein n=1 Tax=Arsenicicoccus sp. oral taxon 190 TaxID=1658671 RepID=UPI0012E1067F|nr:DUF58 domain-containing protein [Arsenicicoccus sp. oral taxon 190]
MSSGPRHTGWALTPTQVTVTTVGVLLAGLAVVAHRPDLLVVALPLLVVATWARLRRPAADTRVVTALTTPTVGEGNETAVVVTLDHDPAADVCGLDVDPGRRVEAGVRHGALVRALTGRRTTLSVPVRPLIWGRHQLGGGELRLTSTWGGYVSRLLPLGEHELVGLPSPRRLPVRSDALRPAHLIGRHVSRRPGEGAEFAEIRAFRPGDRIRRVHWPTSARTGALHVRTTYAEQDSQVVLLLDVLSDIPHRDPRRPSSVEAAVQAAAHVAGHFTTAGDRVGLRVLGDDSQPVPGGSGRRHLQRLLGALARVAPATDRQPDLQRLRLGLQPGSLLLVLTPLTSTVVVDAVAALARQRLDVAVIDVAPTEMRCQDDSEATAWRLLTLERDRTRDLLERAGVPVVGWQDAASVEDLLRRLQRRRQQAAQR